MQKSYCTTNQSEKVYRNLCSLDWTKATTVVKMLERFILRMKDIKVAPQS